FVLIVVDGNDVAKTKSTKKPGVFEWQEHFVLASEADETVYRFELRRKSTVSFLGNQLLASTETSLSELLLRAQKASRETGSESLGRRRAWKLFVRLVVQDLPHVAKVEHPRISHSLSEVVAKLEAFMQLGDALAQLHPFAFIAWRTATAVYTDIKPFPEKIPMLEETIRKLLVQTSECIMFVQECSGHGFAKRLVSTAWVDRRINDFTDSFTSLKRALESGVAVQTTIRIVNIQNLMKLNPVDMDDPSRPECLPNTRMDIQCLWLHGFPGAGKSTIATSVANLFRQQRRLGAFTFFTRGFDPRICDAISRVIEETPSIKQAPLHWQFQRLLADPFRSLEDIQHEGPVLVVIDALDECGRTEHAPPTTLRIFITSRTEKDIHNAISTHSHIISRELDLASEANERDVKTHRLQNEYLDLPPDWPGASRVDALTLRASGLFVWAATACRYVENAQDPEERLSQLCARGTSDSESALDNIYITALESAGKWDDRNFGYRIVAENPLTPPTIDILNADFTGGERSGLCLLQWAADKPIRVFHPSFADFITERRRCGRDAWHINKSHHHLRLARQCIAQEYLPNTLSRSFEVQNLPDATAYPCTHWIDHLCEVQCSEHSLSREIDGFLRQHFLHWVEAMSAIGRPRQTITLMDKLREWVDDAERFCQAYAHVFERHPLLVYQSALPFTPTSSVIYKTFNEPTLPQVDGFRDQWSPLLTEFSKPGEDVTSVSCSKDGRYIVSSGTRSISLWDHTSYELVTTMLPGARNTANVVKFSPDSQHIASGHIDGSEILPTMKGHGGSVYALDFSEDGTQLASAGQDKNIVLWDVRTGEMHREPLSGHTKTVLCLCFAHSGTRFASGSRDRFIRIWDAGTGKEVLPPILYHAGAVNALVYTPDGRRLISASDDKVICVWDANSGTLQRLPGTLNVPFILHGHSSAIYSLSISPDSTCSYGTPRSVRQHRLPVRFATFTADGRRIVTSSFNDPILRLWDTESTGSMGITRRHKGLVGYVSFSSDGQRLVSGGKDRRVRVWDVETGAMTAELFLEREFTGWALDDAKAVFAWKSDTHEPLMATPGDAPRLEGYRGPLSIIRNQWIVNARTEEVLLMFPNMSPIMRKHLGTANGGIVIVDFMMWRLT
ncbi:hypothetical protein BKA82DRAFT_4203105, partial [Pisolithus tinctorius]